MVSGRSVYGISMGFKKRMSDCGSYISQGFCFRHSMGFLCSNGVECLCDVYGVSAGCLWDFYRISMVFLWDFYGISMEFLWDV